VTVQQSGVETRRLRPIRATERMATKSAKRQKSGFPQIQDSADGGNTERAKMFFEK